MIPHGVVQRSNYQEELLSMSALVEVGMVVEGIVTGITNFGAFVELPNGKTGLVHISEIADTYVNEVSEYVKKGDRIKVKVLSINEDATKIGLSLRQGNPGPPEFVAPKPQPAAPRPGGRGTFEDKMQKFMKESDEKISEFRRNRNNRRSGKEIKR